MTGQDWIAVGAAVAETGGRERSEFTTITRITATQIVLANGSRYRRADSPSHMKKVGEGRVYLHSWRELEPAAVVAGRMRSAAVCNAGSDCYAQANRGALDADTAARALDAMQAAVDAARARLAEIESLAPGATLAARDAGGTP